LNHEPSTRQPKSDSPQADAVAVERAAIAQPDSGPDTARMQRTESTSNKKGPKLTTSGTLASTGKDAVSLPSNLDPNLATSGFARGDDFLNSWQPSGADVNNIPSYAEEFPLFSLMNDYTSGDSYLDIL